MLEAAIQVAKGLCEQSKEIRQSANEAYQRRSLNEQANAQEKHLSRLRNGGTYDSYDCLYYRLKNTPT